MNLGSKIKELRKQRGITQEQLANAIGISFQAVSKWENNIALPDITLAPVLANYFGVTMDEQHIVGNCNEHSGSNHRQAYRERNSSKQHCNNSFSGCNGYCVRLKQRRLRANRQNDR